MGAVEKRGRRMPPHRCAALPAVPLEVCCNFDRTGAPVTNVRSALPDVGAGWCRRQDRGPAGVGEPGQAAPRRAA